MKAIKRLAVVLMHLVMIICFVGCGKSQESSTTTKNTPTTTTENTPTTTTESTPTTTTVKVPSSAEKCIGVSYIDVGKRFDDAGFKSISANKVEDLKANQADLLDTVATISIDGNTSFSSEQEFDESSAVLIEYHGYAKCPIKLNVDFEENLFLSRYDVNLLLDGSKETTMEHGKGGDFAIELYPGKHIISFEKEDKSEVNGSIELDVTGEINVSVKIKCHSDNVDVETLYLEDFGAVEEGQVLMTSNASDYKKAQLSVVSSELHAAGFTNIIETAVYDMAHDSSDIGVITEVSIDGKTDFHRGDIFQVDAPVIIKYHEDEAKDPVKIAAAENLERLEKNLPKSMAKRAVIVAMTNGQASDVFASDGNTYDVNKFHSYSDIGEFFMTVERDGTWSAIDENTWRIEGIVLRIYNYDTYLSANCNVKMDGDNYVVHNVDRSITRKENIDTTDPAKINTEHWEPSESNPFLTVPSSLISDDRDESAARKKMTAKEERQNWIDGQFNQWDGRHKVLSDLIKDNLNDSKSFKHVDAKYIDVCDDSSKSTVNEILASAGVKQRVDIGDLFVMEIFTAKNAFNATIKNTGYGIVYSDGTVVLLAIE